MPTPIHRGHILTAFFGEADRAGFDKRKAYSTPRKERSAMGITKRAAKRAAQAATTGNDVAAAVDDLGQRSTELQQAPLSPETPEEMVLRFADENWKELDIAKLPYSELKQRFEFLLRNPDIRWHRINFRSGTQDAIIKMFCQLDSGDRTYFANAFVEQARQRSEVVYEQTQLNTLVELMVKASNSGEASHAADVSDEEKAKYVQELRRKYVPAPAGPDDPGARVESSQN
ncbi:hypothetical protein LZC95_52040 [Pendulispora brunnea]|uniref:Terminase small subunit n=1 Tax=Pendulispora brunnea TaxID=2905690 RepID=A0ABZ2KC76_9BACT